MGFRNPIRTAEAVDTGQPAGAGARVYQGSDETGTFGVLEFRDGLEGDDPAQVIGRGNMVPQPGGGFTTQGGSLAMRAGSYNGITGPDWQLAVESAPAGGYRPVARLVGADLVDLGGPLVLSDDPALTPYTPQLTGAAGNPILGTGGVLAGFYRRIGRLVYVSIYLFTGGTTGAPFNGGNGAWRFTLPFAPETASGREQHLRCKAFTSIGNFDGFGQVGTALGGSVQPFLPASQSDNRKQPVRDAIDGAAGTGIPQVPGSYPFLNGHNLTLSGWYEAAASS